MDCGALEYMENPNHVRLYVHLDLGHFRDKLLLDESNRISLQKIFPLPSARNRSKWQNLRYLVFGKRLI